MASDRPWRRTLWLIRVACVLYLATLTVLLLSPDPLGWLLGVAPDISPPDRGVHFSALFILATLCAASRLPWRASILGVALVIYAISTESLQSLVENRTVELIDYGENLLGLAAGAAAWTLGCRLFHACRGDDVPDS